MQINSESARGLLPMSSLGLPSPALTLKLVAGSSRKHQTKAPVHALPPSTPSAGELDQISDGKPVDNPTICLFSFP